ncbi:hypothetical protein B0J11DRAFT_556220 [Dendryphion nanum]|uniref:Uncharacterized protein n=1 Tax=Dendryphion nanum TaxID=256645 RepID=A0A9P9E9Y7_9PLEO|nr:hypothetical protein B0J11DRAFT_556220 [Dendryphion nanum]
MNNWKKNRLQLLLNLYRANLIGGGRGLSPCMTEALVEAGGKSFVLTKLTLESEYGGTMHYHQVDVSKNREIEGIMEEIGSKYQRIDGLIAGATIQQVTPALDYSAEDIAEMLAVNYTGTFFSARACVRQMQKYKIQGPMCFIASMSGTIANKGFVAPIYNSSKAAVIQSGGIRVNTLSPVHIVTPMVEENFRKGEADQAAWEENSMLDRLSKPEEYQAAGLFLLSRGRNYTTGADLVMDGGCSSW